MVSLSAKIIVVISTPAPVNSGPDDAPIHRVIPDLAWVKRGLRPRTPGVYRFLGLQLGRKAKGQSEKPCPAVWPPVSALRSLSSVALSSAPAMNSLAKNLEGGYFSVPIGKILCQARSDLR